MSTVVIGMDPHKRVRGLISPQRLRSVPIANEDRLVVADTLGTTRWWPVCGRVASTRYVVRRSHQGAPVVRRSVSELVSTDVAALDNAATQVRRTFF
jgi:hypothetical protein